MKINKLSQCHVSGRLRLKLEVAGVFHLEQEEMELVEEVVEEEEVELEEVELVETTVLEGVPAILDLPTSPLWEGYPILRCDMPHFGNHSFFVKIRLLVISGIIIGNEGRWVGLSGRVVM